MQRMRRVYFSISFSLPTVSSVRQGRSPSTLTPEAFSVNIHSRQSSECPCHSKEEDRKTKVRKEMLFFLLPWGKNKQHLGARKKFTSRDIIVYSHQEGNTEEKPWRWGGREHCEAWGEVFLRGNGHETGMALAYFRNSIKETCSKKDQGS